MSVKIRLRRLGKKKQPHYRIVVTDSRAPRDGRFVENLGYYQPVSRPAALKVDLERVDYWVGQGAILSPTVGSLVSKARAGGDDKVALVTERAGDDARAAAAENGAAAAAADAEDSAASAAAEPTDAATAEDDAEPAAAADTGDSAEPTAAADAEDSAEPAADDAGDTPAGTEASADAAEAEDAEAAEPAADSDTD